MSNTAEKTKAERFMAEFDRMRERLIVKIEQGMGPLTIASMVMAEFKDLAIFRDSLG